MRPHVSLVFGILGVAAVCALPAHAQKTGTRIDHNAGAVGSVSRLDAETAAIAANTFAQCLARREGKSMRNALAFPFVSPEQSKAIARLRTQFEECLGNANEFDQLVLGQVLQAGGAAEWFVRTELKNVDLSSLKGMSDEALEKTSFRPRTALEDLGLCIVRRDPDRARGFVESKMGTLEAKTAFKAITPDLGPCVTGGTEMKLNSVNLRAVVSYALYRASSMLGATGA
ncbi:hypothetical protein [Sphingomonas sp. GB1N7]|uniref:hypothetical protein n=1 Tax=Parasphingomonas caseinilytica TaxID=3096158 RepID=UPI002FCB1DE0